VDEVWRPLADHLPIDHEGRGGRRTVEALLRVCLQIDIRLARFVSRTLMVMARWRGRFVSRAARSGTRRDVNDQSQHSMERRLLLDLLGNRTEAMDRAGVVSLLRQVNWQAFLAAASQDLYPYLAFRLEPYIEFIEAPKEWEVLFNARRLTAVHNLRLRHELGRAIEALQRSGIPALVLKGIVLAYAVYGDPSLRPMTDLDLLVPTGTREKALDVLHELGFEYPDGIDAMHKDHSVRFFPGQEFAPPLRLRGSKVLLEVHTQLECSEPMLLMPVQEFWSRSVAVDLKGLTVRTLCPEDFLFHLCLHASRAHRFEGGLRPMVDLRILLDSRADWDWTSIAARSIQSRCAAWMYVTLEAARNLVGAPIPDLLFQNLPQPGGFANLRHLAEEQILPARCAALRLPLIPTLLAEHSWRDRMRMLFNRMRLVRRQEVGPGPMPVRLIRLARLSFRRLLFTLKIVIPRFRRARAAGQWNVGAIWRSARLTRHGNRLFRLVEQEAGILNTPK